MFAFHAADALRNAAGIASWNRIHWLLGVGSDWAWDLSYGNCLGCNKLWYLLAWQGMCDDEISVEQFCRRYVEPMGEESDHVHIVALTNALQVSHDSAH